MVFNSHINNSKNETLNNSNSNMNTSLNHSNHNHHHHHHHHHHNQNHNHHGGKSKLISLFGSSNNIKLAVPNTMNIQAAMNNSLNNSSSVGNSLSISNAAKSLSEEDKKINLNALKNQDPFVTSILDMVVRVAVYRFIPKKNEWRKLDVEGSLIIFERMVEPLHNIVVMNTLALNLFLQPITSDIEFQDRNPFLLYKSPSNEIIGIWFIDKDDCERIKTLIIKLTESAKQRRSKRIESNTNSENTTENGKASAATESASSAISALFNDSLITPFNLLNSSNINKTNVNGNDNSIEQIQGKTDIIQMLAKAQIEYEKQASSSKQPNTIDQQQFNSLPASLSSSLSMSSSLSTNGDINNKFTELFVNSASNMLKSADSTQYSPSSSSTSTTSGGNNGTLSNPILKLLGNANSSAINSTNMKQSSSSSTNTINESLSTQELISLDLKRKLNIPIASTNTLTQTSTTISNNSMMLKGPITVKDFEENLLNQSTTSTTTSYCSSSNQSQKALFYLSNDTITDDYSKAKSSLPLMTGSLTTTTISSDLSSSSSSSGSSSGSESDCESSSPNTLPLLLTPAAFESSSASSTTSSTFNTKNTNNMSNMPHQQTKQIVPNQFFSMNDHDLLLNANDHMINSLDNMLADASNFELMNRTQFKQAFMHMLNVNISHLDTFLLFQFNPIFYHFHSFYYQTNKNDDQFVNSLHQTYLKLNMSKSNNTVVNSNSTGSSNSNKNTNNSTATSTTNTNALTTTNPQSLNVNINSSESNLANAINKIQKQAKIPLMQQQLNKNNSNQTFKENNNSNTTAALNNCNNSSSVSYAKVLTSSSK
jgi:hypothetical protein